jgi:erythronate-4-phosphate dehydrogenase
LNADNLAEFRGWLINTSRGAVIDNAALRHGIEAGRGPSATVLDVWEGEPRPDPVLAGLVDIGTAHVAGYAADSKWEATRQMAVAVARFLASEGAPVNDQAQSDGLPRVSIAAPPYANPDADLPWLAELAHTMCPLRRDHDALRGLLAKPHPGTEFEAFRANYPGRRLMRRHVVSGVPDHLREVVESALTCRCE